MAETTNATGPSTWQYVAVAVIAVLIGGALGPQVADSMRESPDTVAVIKVEGPITAGHVDAVREDLREARRDGSVKAVVLRVNSPGGAVAASESLYLAVNRTAREMPVVASVSGLGASGAYYGMMPSERIYVTPGSIVGSVGVIASVPSGGPTGGRIVTGPDKTTGGTSDETRVRIETMRRTFVDTVFFHRGDRLEVSREQLSYAKVYTGARATQNGVADRVGGLDTAIADAADRAGIENYRVVTREPPRPSSPFLVAGSGTNRTVVVRGETFGWEGVRTEQYLALWGLPEEGSEVKVNGSE